MSITIASLSNQRLLKFSYMSKTKSLNSKKKKKVSGFSILKAREVRERKNNFLSK